VGSIIRRWSQANRAKNVSSLTDLDCGDLWGVVGVDPSHASTDYAPTEEAHDADDLAFLGEMLAYVFVELVDGVRWLFRGECDAVRPRLRHNRTMAARS